MENKKKKSTGLLLSILGVISLVLITAGVTYAFFSYAKQGVTPNTISTGTITFVYNEDSLEGLSIENALPKSDSVGISENGDGFEFSVTSKTPSTATIDYIVTARMDASSTLPQDQVKLYLTSTEAAETAGATYGVQTGTAAGSIKTFNQLANASTFTDILKTGTIGSGVVEKVIYKGQIPAGQSTGNGFTRNFKLNMWLVGANEVTTPASCSVTLDEGVELNQANCTAAGGEYTAASTSTSTSGMADYSAFEFVKLTALGTPTVVAAHCSDNTSTQEACTGDGKTWIAAKNNYASTPVEISSLTEGTNWLRSVPYYQGVEANPATVTPAEWTRLAYVNYDTKQVITVAQAQSDNFTAPTLGSNGQGWQQVEQYYPLNGQEFTVTINVYAEGATTYTTPSNNP